MCKCPISFYRGGTIFEEAKEGSDAKQTIKWFSL